jgi:hypothetical protein
MGRTILNVPSGMNISGLSQMVFGDMSAPKSIGTSMLEFSAFLEKVAELYNIIDSGILSAKLKKSGKGNGSLPNSQSLPLILYITFFFSFLCDKTTIFLY